MDELHNVLDPSLHYLTHTQLKTPVGLTIPLIITAGCSMKNYPYPKTLIFRIILLRIYSLVFSKLGFGVTMYKAL